MDLSHKRVLIVDDISLVRKTFINTLFKIGSVNIFEAATVFEAKRILSEQSIDIIFSDWHMEGGDGIDLLKFVRANSLDQIKNVVFIMVTGGKERAFEAMDHKANNIIHKPFDVDDILFKLNVMKNCRL